MKAFAILLTTAALAALSPQQRQKVEAEAATDAAFLVAYSALQESPRPVPSAPAPRPDGLPINNPPKVSAAKSIPIVLASHVVELSDQCEACEAHARGNLSLRQHPEPPGSHEATGPVRRVFADKPVRSFVGRVRDERPVRRFLGRLFCRGCR